MSLSALLAASALAANPYLPQALEQIRALDEQAALATLSRALAYEGSTPTEAGTAHLYLGLVHALRAKEREAVAEFEKALALDPELRLPAEVSSLVVGWWHSAGGKVDPPAPAVVVREPPVVVVAPPAPAAPPSRWKRYAGAGFLAGAIAVLAGGLGVGERARTLHSFADASPTLGDALSYQRGAESYATGANAMFIVAGVLAAAGVVLFMLDL